MESKHEQNAALAEARNQPGHGGRTDAQRLERLAEIQASINQGSAVTGRLVFDPTLGTLPEESA